MHEVLTQLRQRPPAVGKADVGWGRIGEGEDGGDLLVADASRCPAAHTMVDAGDAIAIKRLQIGIHGVDIDAERASNVDSRHPIGIQEQRFGTAFLPRP